jgi:pimeloyl-ACP methyl ester carboxylesterase
MAPHPQEASMIQKMVHAAKENGQNLVRMVRADAPWISTAALLWILLVPAGEAYAASAQPPVRCARLTFMVAQAPGQPAENQMAAWLCARGSIQHKTIQVLIHGATYDHHYWDFPFQPERYSYVSHMTAAGYAVLNLDRIGHGESTRPPSGLDVTLHTAAFNIHQVVQQLRSGTMRVPGFGPVRAERVQLVGFSLGSFISTIEASTYQDVDAVILSAYSHTVGPGGQASFLLSAPAAFDPKFAPLNLSLDYLVAVPGAKEQILYYTPNADPAVIALDEELRQTITLGETLDIFPSLPASIGVRVPTLLVVGNFDSIACAESDCTATNTLASEPQHYPPEACLEMHIVPEAGHSLNLHLNAQTWFAIAREWSDRRVGASTKSSPPQSCP